MATCNGERFISQQIDSILQQKHVEVTLIISDDRSSDRTPEILNQYSKQYSKVIVTTNQNTRSSAKNFYSLITHINANDYDYVALSDQDDVWAEHRISRAIDQLNNHHADGYSSDVISVDEQLKVKKLIKKSYAQKKYDFMFESPGPGCSFVLTKKLFQFIQTKIDHKTINFPFHDWLIYALARSHGYRWRIDDAPNLFYRQHANNQLGANDGWLAFIKRVQKVLSGQYRRNLTDLHSIIYPGQQPLSLARIGFYLLNILYTRRKFIHCLQNFVLLIIISFQKNKTKSF